MILENLGGPNALLESYKAYEDLLNVGTTALIKDLFQGAEDGGKKELEEIREQCKHYEKAYLEVMTLSEDIVDFKIFRVMT